MNADLDHAYNDVYGSDATRRGDARISMLLLHLANADRDDALADAEALRGELAEAARELHEALSDLAVMRRVLIKQLDS